jgi:HlyD family secretion protein
LDFQPSQSLVEAYQKANPGVTFQFPEMGDEKGHKPPEGNEANADMTAPPSEGEDMQAPPELPENQKIVWIKKDKTISPQMIKVGETDEINYELVSGLSEGDEIVVSMKSSKPQAQTEEAGGQSSPFMPKPPGGNKKK